MPGAGGSAGAHSTFGGPDSTSAHLGHPKRACLRVPNLQPARVGHSPRRLKDVLEAVPLSVHVKLGVQSAVLPALHIHNGHADAARAIPSCLGPQRKAIPSAPLQPHTAHLEPAWHGWPGFPGQNVCRSAGWALPPCGPASSESVASTLDSSRQSCQPSATPACRLSSEKLPFTTRLACASGLLVGSAEPARGKRRAAQRAKVFGVVTSYSGLGIRFSVLGF